MQSSTAITRIVLMFAIVMATVAAISMVDDEYFTVNQAIAQSPAPNTPFAPGQVTYIGDAIADRLMAASLLPESPPYFPPEFTNMTHGNAARHVIVPYLAAWMHQEITPHFSDPSLAFRYVTLSLNAGYDATAPYHETAVGVYSRIENRPASESVDYENMNIAAIHASYQLFMKFDPGREAQWRQMLIERGLNPDDRAGMNLDCFQQDAHSISNPVAIGNLAGKCVWEGRINDGFNHAGDKTNGYPFMDTTGYVPVNSANQLNDPSKWQPLIIRQGEGEYVSQQFVTPQWANTQTYSDFDPRAIRSDVPVRSDYQNNRQEYIAQAQEVVDAVANLNDRQKIIAEYFDNKARGTIFSPPLKQIESPMEFYQLDFLLHFAEFDSGIVAWQEKARHDVVRPITAIQYLYADQMIPTYDDKDASTPSQVLGKNWEPYLDTSNHPEYPSATACFCAAEAQAWKRYQADFQNGQGDVIAPAPWDPNAPGFSGTLREGSSIREVGITPANNVNISYATWSDYVRDCADSRVWTGVHFQDAVDEAIDVCTVVGDHAYDYFATLLDGTAPQRGPDREQTPDTGIIIDVTSARICR